MSMPFGTAGIIATSQHSCEVKVTAKYCDNRKQLFLVPYLANIKSMMVDALNNTALSFTPLR
jgi:hypothetical protein